MRLKIEKAFRDGWFSENFSDAIEKRLNRPRGSSPRHVEIDFSECEWTDPIPLLALLCEVWRWNSALAETTDRRTLIIDLGRAGSGSDVLERRTRTRKFLVKHGFLAALVDACPTASFHYDSSLPNFPLQFNANQVPLLTDALNQASGGALLYHAAPACRPSFVPNYTAENAQSTVKKFIDDIVQTMDDELFRARLHQFGYRDNALVRLRQVATEIVGNACEHAYPQGIPGPICIYARLRERSDRSSHSETHPDSPKINVIHEVTASRYVELFICDIGKGLVADAPEWLYSADDGDTITDLAPLMEKSELSNPQRLRKLINIAFRRPVSRHKRGVKNAGPAKSNITGLLHVNNVLSRHNDRSRISVGAEWVADRHPRDPGHNGGPKDPRFHTVRTALHPPRGTFFHFALNVAVVEPQLDDKWFHSASPNFLGFNRLRGALCNHLGAAMAPVLDLRQMLEDEDSGAVSAGAHIEAQSERYFQNELGTSVVRVSRYFPKGLHDRLISQWIRARRGKNSPGKLLFCDLSHTQALLLADHLGALVHQIEVELADSILDGNRVCLLSEDLIACSFDLTKIKETWLPQRSGPRVSFSPARRSFRFVYSASPPSAEDLIPVLGALRQNDSRQFWNRVRTASGKDHITKSNVVWRWQDRNPRWPEMVLPTYLDYSLATQDRELAKIIRRSLRRALAAFPEANPVAVDDLVASDLADALRWRPSVEADNNSTSLSKITAPLFVISSFVTGSTVERKQKQLGVPAAVLSCFEVDVIRCVPESRDAVGSGQTNRWSHYSALEWIPEQAARDLSGDIGWERVPDTPYIRPYKKVTENHSAGTLLRPLARDLRDISADKVLGRPDSDQSYKEWHRSKLLKIGHWQIAQRHGLIEIDHARTLQRAAESRSSGDFYGWLENELISQAQDVARPLLVYPAGRLGAIMIRYLLHKTEHFSRAPKWRGRVIPINFLPDVGGGLRQISPLTLEHIKSLPGAYGGTVFFVDIGFVGHRTFRHTRRQLLAIGIKKVIGIGLLNRTSFPAMANELSHPDAPTCYWRLDVPTMNDERSCPLCRGLIAMKEFRVRVEKHHPSLVPVIEQIVSDWKPHDPNLSWWDHGLEPITLAHPLTKKFGFRPPDLSSAGVAVDSETSQENSGQLPLFDNGPAAKAPPRAPDLWTSDEVEWRTVTIENSVQAAAYAIEIARTTSQPGYPWRFADALASEESGQGSIGVLAAIEISIGHLILCCSIETAVAIREQGALTLLLNLARCELVEPDSSLNSNATLTAERLRRMRTLAAIALMNLDDTVKGLMLDTVASILATAKLVNAETYCALMAVIIVDPVRFRECVDQKRLGVGEDQKQGERLDQNYPLVGLVGRPIEAQFADTLAYLGQADWHGYAKGELQTITNAVSNARARSRHLGKESADLISILPRLSALLHRTVNLVFEDRVGFANRDFGILFKALLPADSALPLEIFQDSKNIAACDVAPEADRIKFAESALRHINAIRDSFHSAMLRVEDDSSNLTVAQRIQRRLKFLSDLRKHENARQFNFRIVPLSTKRKLSNGARYVMFGVELEAFLCDLVGEAARHGALEPSTAPRPFDNVDDGAVAHLWIGIDFDEAQDPRPRISLWNRGDQKADSELFRHVADGMLRVHRKLGCELKRLIEQDAIGTGWFVTQITLSCIHGGSK